MNKSYYTIFNAHIREMDEVMDLAGIEEQEVHRNLF